MENAYFHHSLLPVFSVQLFSGLLFCDSRNVCFGSEAAGSLHFSDSMAWGAASGQKRPFAG
jgi:hypothetical protein